MKNSSVRLSYGWYAIAGFILGVCVSFCIYFLFLYKPIPNISALRESDINKQDHYQFIDPLLGLQGTTTPPDDFVSLQKNIQSFINTQIQKGNLETASVIARDIDRPASIDINPLEKYSPASLLKVPIMIVYFKMAETDPSILDKQILYTGGSNADKKEVIQSPIQLVPGTSYTVEELIEHMIKYSDNNAATLLTQNLNTPTGESFVSNLFSDLGIHQISITDDFLTIRDYNLFFRVLYNATYLCRNMSEKALKLLSQTDFQNGIRQGVPSTMAVSQKFGEFSLALPTGEIEKRELHNCGIIYYPSHPYMLCVMTKGQDFTKLESVIETISKMVFSHVQDYYSNN